MIDITDNANSQDYKNAILKHATKLGLEPLGFKAFYHHNPEGYGFTVNIFIWGLPEKEDETNATNEFLWEIEDPDNVSTVKEGGFAIQTIVGWD